MIEDSNAAFYIGLNQKSNFSQINFFYYYYIRSNNLPQEPLQIDVQPKLLPTSSTLQDRQENQKVVAAMSSTLSQWKDLELVRQTKSFH
jgi:hypothetical protein